MFKNVICVHFQSLILETTYSSGVYWIHLTIFERKIILWRAPLLHLVLICLVGAKEAKPNLSSKLVYVFSLVKMPPSRFVSHIQYL